jgi:hypothetical protein
MTRMKRKKGVIILLAIAVLPGLVFDLYVGYYNSYIDHDEHAVYFIKKNPTFRRRFTNPFANEGDPAPVDALASDVREELSDYCRYAYGIDHRDSTSLEGCRSQILEDVQ